jgi:hypothetical protein
METSQTRDAWQDGHHQIEVRYEDALIAANRAAVGTPAFLAAMADVRAAHHELLESQRSRPS